ncbi:MAG: hypothetical protein HQL29_06755, partial [Candidatus Omnitrophica bacterium]|nr:hypothetical protein [Candidatus Omnitrophota bacterium]
AEVLRVQGKPDKENGDVIYYGYSFVGFDPEGKVRDVVDFSGNLKFEEQDV